MSVWFWPSKGLACSRHGVESSALASRLERCAVMHRPSNRLLHAARNARCPLGRARHGRLPAPAAPRHGLFHSRVCPVGRRLVSFPHAAGLAACHIILISPPRGETPSRLQGPLPRRPLHLRKGPRRAEGCAGPRIDGPFGWTRGPRVGRRKLCASCPALCGSGEGAPRRGRRLRKARLAADGGATGRPARPGAPGAPGAAGRARRMRSNTLSRRGLAAAQCPRNMCPS